MLQKQLAQPRNLLNTLDGHLPAAGSTQPFDLDALVRPHELRLTLPATLVEYRPDVRAAEEQLHQATAGIGVAMSNRVLNIRLGIDHVGATGSSISSLLGANSGFWNLTAGITEPIFDGGTLEHRQTQAEALQQQAQALHNVTVINAFQNVADTFYPIYFDKTALDPADRARVAAANGHVTAQAQLKLGDASAPALLPIQQDDEQATITVIVARAAMLHGCCCFVSGARRRLLASAELASRARLLTRNIRKRWMDRC